MTPENSKAERDGARSLYLLSVFLPVLVIPLVCLGPVAFFLPVLYLILLFVGFNSRRAFVRWHTGQWALLTVGAGAVALGGFLYSSINYRSSLDLWAMFIGAGGWWLGNLIGLMQANAGQCTLWRWLSPSAPLPRPWQLTSTSAKIFARGQRLSQLQYQKAEAINCFMQVFRAGPSPLRQQAIAELEKLGEVEVF